MPYVNTNGKFIPATEPVVTADSRGLRYGYGVFETMLVREGILELESLHRARLERSLDQLGLDSSDVPALFEKEVLRTVRKNKLERLCRVRLQVMAGPGGFFDRDGWQPEWLIECFPLEEHAVQLNENGLVLGIATSAVKQIDAYSSLKTCNALVYALAAKEATEKKWNDAFVKNPAGRIGETTISNVFWVERGTVYTPPLSEGCIAGVMRQHLLEALPAAGWAVSEAPLSIEKLQGADEVFVTNAVRKIRWVGQVHDKMYTGDLSRAISSRL